MRVVLTALLVVTVVACTTSPTGRRQLQLFPEEQMAEMGVTAFAQMQEKVPVAQDKGVQAYVECVADAITRQLPEQREWEVKVFKDDSANAFALPGGKIGVHTGLLTVAETPAQLAAVIGHEVGHVIAQHSNERMSTAFATDAGLQIAGALAGADGSQGKQLAMAALGLGAQFGVLLPFSRTQESESDQIGLQLMAQAGFDPQEAVTLWQNMMKSQGDGPPEFLSTHPSGASRIERLQEQMPEAMKLYQQARAAGRKPNCSP